MITGITGRILTGACCILSGVNAHHFVKTGDSVDLGFCVFFGLIGICNMLGVVVEAIEGRKP